MKARCEICGKVALNINFQRINLPELKGEEIVISREKCEECGFEDSDIMIANDLNKPVRYTLRIEKKEQINARVVKSKNASIEIPELGIKITPGPSSQSYISNVEGVLMRIEENLEEIKKIKPHEVKKIEKLIKEIEEIREGKRKATLIIFDPSGNSLIGDDNAVREDNVNT